MTMMGERRCLVCVITRHATLYFDFTAPLSLDVVLICGKVVCFNLDCIVLYFLLRFQVPRFPLPFEFLISSANFSFFFIRDGCVGYKVLRLRSIGVIEVGARKKGR